MSDFEDRFAIGELIDLWSNAANVRDWTTLVNLLTEDGVWQSGLPHEFTIEGRKNILAAIIEMVSPMDYLVQMPHAKGIWLDGNKAKARSTFREICRYRADGKGMQLTGTYHDDLIKDDKGWHFTKRRIQLTCINPEPPPGQVLNPVPE